jgi:hypothetical protein
MFRKLALISCMFWGLAAMTTAGWAQSTSDADAASFRQIISEQIAAFNADDGAKAWSYAAPSIQQIFPTPDIFMSMVKNGYQPVYRQKSLSFGEITGNADRPVQHVTIVDTNGRVWEALYTMQKQPDGTWKISGCVLAQVPGVGA